MESKVVCLIVCLVADVALAAPQQEPQRSIEDGENGFFFSNSRIVGGENVAEGGAKHIAAITTGNIVRSLVCGGSCINSRNILTAAHCIEAVFNGVLIDSLRIHVGSNKWSSGDTRYSLAGNLTHPNYLSSTIKNDIGILITNTDIELTDKVATISLSFEHIHGGLKVLASGWGRERAGGSLPTDLKQVLLYTLSGEECVKAVHEFGIANNYYNVPPVEPHIELCTFHSVGKGTCNGDSGSALVEVKSKKQVGLVSWGFPCGIGAPDMFVRISGFEHFLKKGLKMIL